MLKSAKEVMPQVLLMAGFMSAGGAAYRKVTKPESAARDELLEDYEKDATAKEILISKEEERRVRAEALGAEEAAAVFEEEAIEREVIPEEKPIRPKEEAIEDDKERERRLAREEREREELGRPIPEPVPSREEIEAGRILEEAADEAREIKPEVAKKEPIKFVGTRETAKGEFPIFEDKSGFQIDYKPAEHEISNIAEYEAARPRLAIPAEPTAPEAIREELKAKPIPEVAPKLPARPKPSKTRTLRGAIKELGGIDFLQYTGELKDLEVSARRTISKRGGLGIDQAVDELIADGWLDKNTTVSSFLEDLRTKPKALLGRDKIAREIIEKKPYKLSAEEKRLKAELEQEVEAPPEGDYTTINAEDLPKGKELTLLEGKTTKGWDLYEVTAKDPFEITLMDGQEVKLSPLDKVQVLKKDVKDVPVKPITPKPAKPTPPEAVEKEIKAEPIPKVEPKPKKEPKVEAPPEKAPTKPEPGKAWIKGKQKPILSAREITKGKNKGKYEITLTRGRDAEGDIIPGAKKIVEEKAIITMPKEIKPYEKPAKKEVEVKEAIPTAEGRAVYTTEKIATEFPQVVSDRAGSYKSGVRTIVAPQDAAAFAHLNLSKYPQEHLASVILDKDRKIISVHRYSIGAPGQAPFSPSLIAGHALNTPDAANLIIVHNHPSGDPLLSPADVRVFDGLKNTLKGTRVSANDIIAVGENKYSSYSEDWQTGFAIPDVKAKYEIPMVERVFKQRGKNLYKVSGEDSAAKFGKDHLPEGGLILLNTRNDAVGVLPMDDYSRFRDGMSEVILKQVDATNAVNIIAYNPDIEIPALAKTNLAKFARATDLNLFDIIDSKGSWQAKGIMPVPEDEKFFAAKAIKPQATITRQDLQSIFGKMKNIRTGVNPQGNFYFKVEGRPAVEILEVDHVDGFIQIAVKGEKERIAVGSYLKNQIQLKTGGKGFTADINTAWHEFHHYLEKNGIVTANDIKALDNAIDKAEVTEEDRATYVGDRLAAWKVEKNTRIKRILKKISDFANAIYEFFTRTRTARGVLRDIEAGRILRKEVPIPREQIVSPAYQQTAERFYSQVVKTVEDKMPAKMQASAVIPWLKKQPGVKPAELEWMSIEEMLEGKKVVGRDELAGLLRENEVRVKEIEKGGKQILEPDIGFLEELFDVVYPDGYRMEDIEEAKEYIETNQLESDFTPEQVLDAWNKYEEYQKFKDSESEDTTKFAQYQLPGEKENYRELLFTLPIKKTVVDKTTDEYAQEIFDLPFSQLNDAQRKKVITRLRSDAETFDTTTIEDRFESTHWEEPNVFAHVRTNERTDADGNRILFIEEIQSDWAAKGRKEGYQVKDVKRRLSIKQNKAGNWILEDQNRLISEHVNEGDAEKAKQKYADKLTTEGVPDMPFKKNWHEVVLKRMIRQAAEQGFDKIAWITGQQTADRYDLSKQISQITYQKDTDGNYTIFAYPHEGDHIEKAGLNQVGIAEFIGKEIAEKIVGSGKDSGKLSGLDLKVGGEWAYHLYDKMIPQYLKKFGKKFGAEVGTAKIEIGGERIGEYVGPELDIGGLNAIPDSDLNAAQRGQIYDVGSAMEEDGLSFKRAMEEYGSRGLAEIVGGKFEARKETSINQTLTITPELKRAALFEGMPLFQTKPAEVPTFAETREPVTEEDWIANRKVKKDIKLTLLTNVKRVASEIAAGVDKYLGVISTRLGNVSPKLKNKLRQLDFDINTNYAEDVKAVEPLLRKSIKMEKNDIIDWDYARKNSVVGKINELVIKYGMQKEYAAYRDTLDKVREEGLDVGLDIGEIPEYAPRILRDERGFLKAINKPEYRPLYTDRLKKRAAGLDMTVEAMPLDMKADIISNIILGGWSGLGGVPATRQRVLKKIPVELNKFYMDSDAALMQHLYSMRKAIEARRFFGKIPKKVAEMRKRLYNAQTLIRTLNSNLAGKLSKGQLKELARLEKSIKSGKLDEKQLAGARRTVGALKSIATDTMPDEQIATIKKNRSRYIGLEREYTAYIATYGAQRDYTQNIGAYIIELIDKGEIDAQHEGVVNDILNARFHEKGTRGIIQAYKNMSYVDTMGSPISALTQIGDFAWPAYLYGVPATLKHAYRAAIKKSKITQADVGIQRVAQEFADSGTLGDAVSKVFKMVGLEKMDSIAAETLLNAALEDYQKQAKNNPAKLKKEIRVIFEAETDSVIEDLVNDEISGNVKLLVYHKLLDFQPKALSETPQKYLSAGNGRIFYMLKTFTIKQFDIFRRISYNKIVKGDKAEKIEGLKNLVKMSMFFVLANAGADELKDWVLGRKTDFDDRVADNMLRLFGISKFVTWKARTEGVGSALARQILPPFKFIDSAGKDIVTFGDEKGLEVIGSVPVAGKLAYWHMGRGLSKREDLWNRRLRKRKARLNKTKDRLDVAKNKMEFRRKHHVELLELKRINKLQGRLNKKRKRINGLKSLAETVERKKQIQRLEIARTDMIKNFLGK
ncbi:MAG: hypothetical protein KAS66_09455 [Candidatus Omnitrophica bacterium]|nr:hypothetical protein [Candidatus Omnitrophota bacterium]